MPTSVCPQHTDVIRLPLMCLNGCVDVTAIIFRVYAELCRSFQGDAWVGLCQERAQFLGGGEGYSCSWETLLAFSAALCTFQSVASRLEPVLRRSRVLFSHLRHMKQSCAVCSGRDNNSDLSRFLQTQLLSPVL